MSDTTDTSAETPEQPSTDPTVPAEDPTTGGGSDGTSVPSSAPDEGTTDSSETPSTPTVVNDDSGQHVVMPDGLEVTTRTHTYPVSNSEWENYELTHSGDQLRYPYKPGDKEYSPYSDPNVPNTHMAQMVEREIQSFAARVLEDAEAVVSPMWNALHGIYEGELKQAIATGGGSGKVEA